MTEWEHVAEGELIGPEDSGETHRIQVKVPHGRAYIYEVEFIHSRYLASRINALVSWESRRLGGKSVAWHYDDVLPKGERRKTIFPITRFEKDVEEYEVVLSSIASRLAPSNVKYIIRRIEYGIPTDWYVYAFRDREIRPALDSPMLDDLGMGLRSDDGLNLNLKLLSPFDTEVPVEVFVRIRGVGRVVLSERIVLKSGTETVVRIPPIKDGYLVILPSVPRVGIGFLLIKPEIVSEKGEGGEDGWELFAEGVLAGPASSGETHRYDLDIPLNKAYFYEVELIHKKYLGCRVGVWFTWLSRDGFDRVAWNHDAILREGEMIKVLFPTIRFDSEVYSYRLLVSSFASRKAPSEVRYIIRRKEYDIPEGWLAYAFHNGNVLPVIDERDFRHIHSEDGIIVKARLISPLKTRVELMVLVKIRGVGRVVFEERVVLEDSEVEVKVPKIEEGYLVIVPRVPRFGDGVILLRPEVPIEPEKPEEEEGGEEWGQEEEEEEEEEEEQ